MSRFRSTCDMRDSHGKPVDQRWSGEWRQYFHLCAKCIRLWDIAHDRNGNLKEIA
jgi:hypothetical protein